MPPKTFKVYYVKAEHSDDIYIGSTTIPISQRLAIHKNPKNTASSRKLLQYGPISITIIELVIDRKQLKEREEYHINAFRNNGFNVINQYRAKR